jgi:acetyl esterase/lipase
VVAGKRGRRPVAVAALACAIRRCISPCRCAFVYPVTDQAADTDSLKVREGYLLTRELLRWYQRNYLRDERDRADWRASPCARRTLAPAACLYNHRRIRSAAGRRQAYAEPVQAGVEVI